MSLHPYTCTLAFQVSLEVFTDAVSHHKERPPVFEIIGRPRLPSSPPSTTTTTTFPSGTNVTS